MARIRFDHINKRWGDFVGVRDFDLDIDDREFLVLLGPSGCGKTTSMRMVAGLETPTEGQIWIGDKMVNDLDPKDRDIAMVFQSYGLYAHLSVYENIRFPLKVRGVPKEQHHDKVMRAANMVELNDFLDRRPKALSGGQRQRVALARAIVREPQCYLMDEPLSNLDARLRLSMRSEIKHLQHELSVTTIYVTHDQVEAMTLADRVVVMSKGEMRQVGKPTEIYDDPEDLFVASFIGSPPMNLIPGNIENGVFKAEGVVAKVAADEVTRENVVLGIRAEELGLTDADRAQIRLPVYSQELLGDSTLITVRTGKAMVTAKAGKHDLVKVDQVVGLSAPSDRFYLFDGASEKRIRQHNGARRA